MKYSVLLQCSACGRGGSGDGSDLMFLQTVLGYNTGQRIFQVVFTLYLGMQEMLNNFI